MCNLSKEIETNDESMKLELKSIALLCDYWAGPGFLKKKSDLKEKFPLFRNAVFAGQGSGTPEDVPFEFLADDYEIVKTAVDYLENECKQGKPNEAIDSWLESIKIPYTFSENDTSFVVSLPVPCPPGAWEILVSRLKGGREFTPSKLAAIIVGKRLPGGNKAASWETVRADYRKRKRNEKKARDVRANLPSITFEKQLLISVFFDLSSTNQEAESLNWRAKILDALMTDYPLIGIYYLVKISNELSGQTYTGNYDFKEVEKLFKFAYPKSKKGPFTKLLQA